MKATKESTDEKPPLRAAGDSSQRSGGGAIGSALIVLTMLLLGRLGGLVRDLIVAPIFGAGVEVDALVAARTVPELVLTLVTAGAVSAGFLPGLSYLSGGEEELPEEGVTAISVIANWLLAATVGVAVLGVLCPEPLIRLVTPGLSSEVVILAARLLRILAPVVVLVTVAALLGAYFNFRNRFALPSARALVINATVVLLTLVLAEEVGIAAVALGWTLGALLQVVLLWIPARNLGIQYSPAFDPRLQHVGYLWTLIAPVLLSQVLLYGRFLVERQFASWLPGGALAYLNYAYRIGTAPMLIVANAVTTAYLPTFSRHFARGANSEFGRTIVQSMSLLLLGICPFAVVFVVLPEPVVALLLQHGAFTASDTKATAVLLRWYTLTLLAASLLALCSQVVYAQRRGALPLKAIGIGVGVQVAVSALTIRALGAQGVALGTGVGLVASAVILGFLAAPRLPGNVWAPLRSRLGRIGTAVAGMAAVTWMTPEAPESLELLAPVVAGGLTYVGILMALRMPELRRVGDLLSWMRERVRS